MRHGFVENSFQTWNFVSQSYFPKYQKILSEKCPHFMVPHSKSREVNAHPSPPVAFITAVPKKLVQSNEGREDSRLAEPAHLPFSLICQLPTAIPCISCVTSPRFAPPTDECVMCTDECTLYIFIYTLACAPTFQLILLVPLYRRAGPSTFVVGRSFLIKPLGLQ